MFSIGVDDNLVRVGDGVKLPSIDGHQLVEDIFSGLARVGHHGIFSEQ